MAHKIARAFLVLLAGLALLPTGAAGDAFRRVMVPLRIVSLYAGHTDNVIALGAGDRLVAVSGGDEPDSFQRLPPNVVRLPMRTGVEAVLALKPDVVLLRSLVVQVNPHLLEALERSGMSVHVIDPPSWDDFEDYLIRLAEILGTDPEEAREKLENLRVHIAQKTAEAALTKNKPRVFLCMVRPYNPPIMFALYHILTYC